jgi:hypothetical protein
LNQKFLQMKTKLFSLLAIASIVGFAACNNSSETATTTDSTTNTTATTTTSTTNYAALADTFQTNSTAGNYLDVRTGKPIRISVNKETGAKTMADNNEPVRYYVDRRTWWVYDANTGNTLGEVKMEGDALRYKDPNGNWISAEEYWKMKDAETTTGDAKVSDNGNKVKSDEGTKVKVADDGNKVKVKDADGNKTKVKDGEVKKDNK